MLGTRQVRTMHRTAPVVGAVYCPLCTHTVSARIERHQRRSAVRTGQQCPRCSGLLDAAHVLQTGQAA